MQTTTIKHQALAAQAQKTHTQTHPTGTKAYVVVDLPGLNKKHPTIRIRTENDSKASSHRRPKLPAIPDFEFGFGGLWISR